MVDLPPESDLPAEPAAPGPRPPSPSRALLAYNLSRLGLFAVATAIVYAVGVHDIWAALLIGLFASAIGSWFLLRRQREAMAVVMEHAVQERKRRATERAAREDAWDEEQRRAAGDDAGARRDDSAAGT